uniref:AMP-dependent synthetase/ligase n=1 Tax=Pseudactinotalea sp. TaxID=1926260 RepID=UPI003B3B7D77
VVDLASWWVGAVVVPIYPTASSAQAAQVIADCRPALAVLGGSAEHTILDAALERLEPAPSISTWTMDTGAHDLDALRSLGHDVTEDTVEARRARVRSDDIATIVYTSGTTGSARGVRITHANLVGVVRNVQAAYAEVIHEGASTVIFLPLAHVLARGLQLVAIATGMRTAHLADPASVVATLPTLRPTFLVVAPRVLQRIRAAVAAKAQRAHLGRLYAAADVTAVAWGRHLERRQDDPRATAPLGLRLRHAVFDRLFYARVRALLGGRVESLLSGAASLGADLSLYFRGLDIPVIEGYGLTETTAPATGQRPGDIRAGTVGVPIPGTAIRLADDGEIQVRGVGVTPGHTDPADDAAAFTVDGWLHTGDLGTVDERGHLTVVGRRKDTLVTSSGKSIEPGPWETTVGAHPLVAHAVMVGTDRPYAAALLLLAPDELRAWAEQHDRPDLAELVRDPASPPGTLLDDAALSLALQPAVEAANAEVSRSEQARRFRAVIVDLDECTTPTLKLRRSAYLESATALIDDLYA